MRNDSISILHVILLSMTVIGLKNHVTILPPILIYAERDGWISVILTAFITIPWLLLLVLIHKKTNQKDIRALFQEKLGKLLSTTFFLVIGISLLILASFTMRETLQWISTTFLIHTPIIILLIIYTVLCVMLATTSLQTLAMTNVIVLFGVIIFGFFVATVNLQVKDYTLLRPFLENGIRPVLKSMVYPASGMIEVVLIIFFQHKVKHRIRFIHYVIIIGILTWLTLGPLIGAITEFGPNEAAKQRFPAYEEWALATIGRFVEHMDFLSIYQWLTGAFIRVGLFIYIIFHLLNIKEKKKTIWFYFTPIFLLVTFSLTLLDDQRFFTLKRELILPISFIFYFALSIFLLLISIISVKSSGRISS